MTKHQGDLGLKIYMDITTTDSINNTLINCSGINSFELLEKLWLHAKMSSFTKDLQSRGLDIICYCNNHNKWLKPDFSQILSCSKEYVGDFAGKTIDVNFQTYPFIDPFYYNLHNGSDLFERIVYQIKNC